MEIPDPGFDVRNASDEQLRKWIESIDIHEIAESEDESIEGTVVTNDGKSFEGIVLLPTDPEETGPFTVYMEETVVTIMQSNIARVEYDIATLEEAYQKDLLEEFGVEEIEDN